MDAASREAPQALQGARGRPLDHAQHIAAARALFPWWVTWGSAIALPLTTVVPAWILGRLLVFVAVRPLARAPADLHWTERARHVHRARVYLITAYFFAGIMGLFAAVACESALSPLPSGVVGLATLVLVTDVFEREYRRHWRLYGNRANPGPTKRLWALDALLLSPIGIWLAVALVLPAEPSKLALSVAAVATVLAMVLYMGGSVWIAIELGWIPHKGLAELGVDTTTRDWSFGRVLVLPMTQMNAFAFGTLREVGVTRGLLAHLSVAELTSVLEHEDGHLKEQRGQGLPQIPPVFAFLPLVCWRPLAEHMSAPLLVVLCAFAFMLVTSLRKQAAQHSEDEADRAAHERFPADYARALEKMHELGLLPATQSKRVAHADLYDRMLAAGVTPDWPRPAPPPSSKLIALGGLLLVAVGTWVCAMAVKTPRLHPERTTAWHVAFGGASPTALSHMAGFAWNDERIEDSLVLYRAAAALDRHDAYDTLCTAAVLVTLGRCAEAQAALIEGFQRLDDPRGRIVEPDWLENVRRSTVDCDEKAR